MRMTRAGTPPATAPAGTSRVTTAPAPMTQPSPRVTPAVITVLVPIQQSGPMTTSRSIISWSVIRAPAASP